MAPRRSAERTEPEPRKPNYLGPMRAHGNDADAPSPGSLTDEQLAACQPLLDKYPQLRAMVSELFKPTLAAVADSNRKFRQ
jgi:hypothetical protein